MVLAASLECRPCLQEVQQIVGPSLPFPSVPRIFFGGGRVCYGHRSARAFQPPLHMCVYCKANPLSPSGDYPPEVHSTYGCEYPSRCYPPLYWGEGRYQPSDLGRIGDRSEVPDKGGGFRSTKGGDTPLRFSTFHTQQDMVTNTHGFLLGHLKPIARCGLGERCRLRDIYIYIYIYIP